MSDKPKTLPPLRKDRAWWYIEMTDTYGGEANYCWVHRFLVQAASERGAIGMVTRRTGYRARADWDSGSVKRYNVPHCAVCYFIEFVDVDDAQRYFEGYSRIEVLPC